MAGGTAYLLILISVGEWGGLYFVYDTAPLPGSCGIFFFVYMLGLEGSGSDGRTAMGRYLVDINS